MSTYCESVLSGFLALLGLDCRVVVRGFQLTVGRYGAIPFPTFDVRGVNWFAIDTRLHLAT